MDPDLGFVPFDWSGEPYLDTKWIEHGVLKELAYPRAYGLRALNKDRALSNSRAFRLSGPTTGGVTVEEMIASTTRGVLVTRFSGVTVVHEPSMLLTGTTRDGLWLVEHGKISKAIKNFRFSESPFFAFNNVEQIGAPVRVFRPDAPAVCSAITVHDFSFTGLSDAV
jgi:predicted Zn-dependent protease